MEKKQNPIVTFANWVATNIAWDIGKPIVSAILSPVFSRWGDVLMLNETFSLWVSVPVYFVLAYGSLQLLTDIVNFLVGDKLEKINRLRTEGVKLRNEKVASKKAATAWIKKYDLWDEKARLQLKKISKSYAEYWRVINRFEKTVPILKGVNDLHTAKLNVLEEKLKRLEDFYKKQANLE